MIISINFFLGIEQQMADEEEDEGSKADKLEVRSITCICIERYVYRYVRI